MADPLEGATYLGDLLAAARPVRKPSEPLTTPNIPAEPQYGEYQGAPITTAPTVQKWAQTGTARALFPGIGSVLGTALASRIGARGLFGQAGGGGVGAGAGEALRQTIADEDISPGRIGFEAVLGAAAPFVARPIGAGIRAVGRHFPGATAAFQKHVIDRLRLAAQGLPRPLSRESYETATATAREAHEAAATTAREAYETSTTAAREAYEAAEAARAGGHEWAQKTGREFFEEGEEALVEQAKQIATGREAGHVRQARRIPGRLPVQEPDFGKIAAYEQASELLSGGVRPSIPTAQLRLAAAKVRDELEPLLKISRSEGLGGDLQLSTAAKKLTAFLDKPTDLLPTELHELSQHFGPLIRTARKFGEPMKKSAGALSQLYKGVLADLEAGAKAGSIAASDMLEAMAQYKRKVAVGTLKGEIEKGVRVKGGELSFEADPLLRELEAPATKGQETLVQRLLQTLTPKELADVVGRLQGITKGSRIPLPVKRTFQPQPFVKGTPPKKAPFEKGAPFKPQPFEEVPAIQDIIEKAIKPVQGAPRGVENVAGIPLLEALKPEAATAKFLAREAPSRLPALQQLAGEAIELEPVRTGFPTFVERLPIYSLLAALGSGSVSGAKGLMLSGAGANALRKWALTPEGMRLILKMSQSQIGHGAGTRATQALLPALGGEMLGP